jgi:P-type Cu+ transporter
MTCYHCGDNIKVTVIHHEGHAFCCHGCVSVYSLLDANGLCSFYDETKIAPLSRAPRQDKYAFLDQTENANTFLQFHDSERSVVKFHSPHIQCASCVYLLERLPQLQNGILQSNVNFIDQSITIHFRPELLTFRQLVEWLTYIGYEPILDAEQHQEQQWDLQKKRHLISIGITGFCFANIMLLSFPEYLNLDMTDAPQLTTLFRYINLFLSVPALIFGGRSFFLKTIQGIRARSLSIDAPLVLSLLITFGRSVYEVLSQNGGGYFDSMTGILFFMLIGKYFQEITQHRLHFSRTYKSFFPISCQVITEQSTSWKMLSQLKSGDQVKLRGSEMIPCDAILLSDHALIDYSFVTGESKPSAIRKGQSLFAGGKLLGQPIIIQITSNIANSYLTSLWNQQTTKTGNRTTTTWVDRWAQYFTWILLLLTFISGWYWWTIDISRSMNAITTLLIVACPCALLLSATFTQGAVLMHLNKLNCFVKNSQVLHDLAKVEHLAWDKTGTLTSKEAIARWQIKAPEWHHAAIVAICNQSTHPLSQSIVANLSSAQLKIPTVKQFQEHLGFGVEGVCEGIHYKIGSAKYTQQMHLFANVVITANDELIGSFTMEHPLRDGAAELLNSLHAQYSMSIISGDPLPTTNEVKAIIPEGVPLFHGLAPQEKKQHIEKLSEQHHRVAMIGDGLNDAGALDAARVGIAITEKSHPFSPACDVMLDARSLSFLPAIFNYAKKHEQIVKWSFGISLIYNVVGLSYAMSGTLHPLIAAILMPLSSITIMLFTTGLAYYYRPKIST